MMVKSSLEFFILSFQTLFFSFKSVSKVVNIFYHYMNQAIVCQLELLKWNVRQQAIVRNNWLALYYYVMM